MDQHFVRVDGRAFTVNGKPLHLRGMGVGSWLNLEHFMMGVPGWDDAIRQCLDTAVPGLMERFTQVFFSQQDAAYLHSIGINLIRVPINHHLFWNDETNTLNPYGFAQLERLAAICEANDIYFLPDLHTTPGGQNPDWHSESPAGVAQFWSFGVFQKRAAAIWGEIAKRLAHSPALLGYDLLNEPVLPANGTALLSQFYAEAIAAIRTADAKHIVFLEGDRFSMDFSKLTPPADHNWAYAYHFYPGVWNEKLLEPQMTSSQRRIAFADALREILSTMGDYQGPLLCGEMGYELALLDEAFGVALTRDTLEIVQETGSSWCLWCYKDAHFMGLIYPSPQSPWMQLVRTLHARWDHHRASQQGIRAVDAMEALCLYSFTDAEKYALQFVLRAQFAKLDAVHLLAPALHAMPQSEKALLADSFAFSACQHNKALEDLIRAKNTTQI